MAVVVAFLAAPATAMLLVLAVLTVRQTEVWKDGVTLWTAVIKRDPAAVPRMTYGNRAVSHLRQGMYVEAIADFDRVIAFEPANYEARFRRGIAWSRMGRLDRAVADFDQVAAMDPTYTFAYKERGKAYDRLNRLAEAAADFDRAIALNPADAEAYLYRGIVAGKSGDREQAIRVSLRAWLGDAGLRVVALRFGLIGFGDVGRVWVDGESSTTWHSSFGGGLLVQPLGAPFMLHAIAANSKEGTRFYVGMGYPY